MTWSSAHGLTLSQTHCLCHTLSLSYTHSLSHKHTLSHTHSYTLYHTLTHTLSHTNSHTLSHTLSQTQFPSLLFEKNLLFPPLPPTMLNHGPENNCYHHIISLSATLDVNLLGIMARCSRSEALAVWQAPHCRVRSSPCWTSRRSLVLSEFRVWSRRLGWRNLSWSLCFRLVCFKTVPDMITYAKVLSKTHCIHRFQFQGKAATS